MAGLLLTAAVGIAVLIDVARLYQAQGRRRVEGKAMGFALLGGFLVNAFWPLAFLIGLVFWWLGASEGSGAIGAAEIVAGAFVAVIGVIVFTFQTALIACFPLANLVHGIGAFIIAFLTSDKFFAPLFDLVVEMLAPQSADGVLFIIECVIVVLSALVVAKRDILVG